MSLFNPSSDYNACPTSDSGKKGDMAKLALVCGIQQGTTSGMSDPQFPLIAGRLGWGSGKMGLYQSAQGVANVVSGYLTGPVLRRTGRVRITYLGNLLQTLSYVGTGLAGSGYTMIGALALRAPVNENSAVQAMLVAQAKRLNIGQGRLAADVANFSAVTKAITPILYGWAAQYSVRYPFFMVSGSCS
jgi:MFS family permease